jgi:hypothetical protein
MHEKAPRKARAAYTRAAQHLTDLKGSNDFQGIEEHWEGFLNEANKVFTRLEHGSKALPSNAAWWGKHAREWKTDPLLQYIRGARDATEHSIQEIAASDPGRFTQIEPTAAELAEHTERMDKAGKPWANLGLYEVVLPHVRVIEVINRRRQISYHPPTTHLGKPHADLTPAAIGDAALAYLEKMIDEAEKLVS